MIARMLIMESPRVPAQWFPDLGLPDRVPTKAHGARRDSMDLQCMRLTIPAQHPLRPGSVTQEKRRGIATLRPVMYLSPKVRLCKPVSMRSQSVGSLSMATETRDLGSGKKPKAGDFSGLGGPHVIAPESASDQTQGGGGTTHEQPGDKLLDAAAGSDAPS